MGLIDLSAGKEFHVFKGNKKVSVKRVKEDYWEVSLYVFGEGKEPLVREVETEITPSPFVEDKINSFLKEEKGELRIFTM